MNDFDKMLDLFIQFEYLCVVNQISSDKTICFVYLYLENEVNKVKIEEILNNKVVKKYLAYRLGIIVEAELHSDLNAEDILYLNLIEEKFNENTPYTHIKSLYDLFIGGETSQKILQQYFYLKNFVGVMDMNTITNFLIEAKHNENNDIDSILNEIESNL